MSRQEEQASDLRLTHLTREAIAEFDQVVEAATSATRAQPILDRMAEDIAKLVAHHNELAEVLKMPERMFASLHRFEPKEKPFEPDPHSTAYRIVEALNYTKPVPVSEIAEKTGLAEATIRYHLCQYRCFINYQRRGYVLRRPSCDRGKARSSKRTFSSKQSSSSQERKEGK